MILPLPRLACGILAACLFLVLAAPPTALAGEVEAPRPSYTVAVLDFDAHLEQPADLGSQLGALVTAYLSREPHVVTVEREQLELALGEQEFGLSGTVSPETAAVVGQLTGAKVLVTGRVIVAADELIVVTKVLGTETSRVFADALEMGLDGSVAETGEQVAQRVAEILSDHGEQLVAATESRDDLLTRLRAAVEGIDLPSVSVTITEEHASRPILDPAAQTEVGHLLRELGFPVVDAHTTARPPDVLIVGEALSEFALRRGNLVSCRGRVEIRALERATGVVLAVDRQTEVAVDLGERMAAKAALQQAAARLVERLVDELVER